ncbi:AarF/ABC1/UbiB kinase family protein [Salinispirillum sp. LH 10-3-1]|uniref:AarF/ABC1/UbiB kinase family protein n=1 Tax=Salinispirillum sp. LH 10-3-1 TaxID=2952525 RepID=A0AB38YEW7_9GAMM
MSNGKSSPLRTSRLGRIGQFGRLATGLAGGLVAEGARTLASGKRPALRDMMLTPRNLTRIADDMARLRGAAMKVGQLLSMDAGNLLPPELAELLGRLRSQADAMPLHQLSPILVNAWGADWQAHFRRFDQRPMAAASIGQVHYAERLDGTPLAIKVQYPGVKQSIDSDVDNLATLLRVTRLLPDSIELAPLLTEAKLQLHAEADYRREAAAQQRCAARLADDPGLVVSVVQEDLSSDTILAMSFLRGAPLESITAQPQSERNSVVQRLFTLLFRELFEFGEVQTDPNFANFLYLPERGQVGLLDFGATREYAPEAREAYHHLLHSGMHNDTEQMASAARQLGYFAQDIAPAQQTAVLRLFQLACEPLRHDGEYDFGRSDLAQRIRTLGMDLSFEQEYWHSPPVASLFLHRKIAGLFLLAQRLQARVNVRACLPVD